MEKEFVPYELALKLKELGFDEECLGAYNQSDNNKFMIAPQLSSYTITSGRNSDKCDIEVVTAPLWQQAFDWFREEKDLLNHLTTHLNTWGYDGDLETSYGYRIMIDKDGWKCDVWEQLSSYETYEEAREECLKKLIELSESSCQKPGKID